MTDKEQTSLQKKFPCAQTIFYQIKNLIQLRDFQPAVAPVFASSTFTRWFLVPQCDFRQRTSSFWQKDRFWICQHREDFGNYILFILDVFFSFTLTNIAMSNFGQMNVIMKDWLKPQNLENYPQYGVEPHFHQVPLSTVSKNKTNLSDDQLPSTYFTWSRQNVGVLFH